MESLLVANDLDGNKHACLVINAPDDLAKTSLSEHIDNLIAVGEVVARHDGVVSTLVVVAEVGRVRLEITNHLASVLRSAKVNVVVINDFAALVNVEHRDPDGFLGTDSLLWRCAFPQGVKSSSRDLGLLSSCAHLLHLLLGNEVVLVEICGPRVLVANRRR